MAAAAWNGNSWLGQQVARRMFHRWLPSTGRLNNGGKHPGVLQELWQLLEGGAREQVPSSWKSGSVCKFCQSMRIWCAELKKRKSQVKTLLKTKCPFVACLASHLNCRELSQFLAFLNFRLTDK